MVSLLLVAQEEGFARKEPPLALEEVYLLLLDTSI